LVVCRKLNLQLNVYNLQASVEHKIDAANKILGRLATEVAILLRGKNLPTYNPSEINNIRVSVYNTDKLAVTGKKMGQKLYRHHTGFHGGLKEEKLSDRMTRDSRLVLQAAVRGMLPKNRSRARFMKNLKLFRKEL